MSLFSPLFTSHYIDTTIGKIFVRKGGSGKPLLLIHGFPQTHVEWHKMAEELSQSHTVIMPDLPGYGWSVAPRPDENHAPYTKRAMAKVMIEVMEYFEFIHFDIIGHDRGARVAYRLELDHKGRVGKLVLIDIIPTFAMWEAIEKKITPANEHWLLLSRPAPEPENEIKKDPAGYMRAKLALWSESKDLSAYDTIALTAYAEFIAVPERIKAVCEDYRAGASQDRALDEADLAAGVKINCPTLVLCGTAGIPASGTNPLDSWGKIASNLTGQAIKGGHFLPEENPIDTLIAVKVFLK